MDLSAFSRDNFDPKEWLNSTFELPEAQQNKEEYAANLVMKLQSFIQEVSISLEKTAEQVIQNVPKITHEVETLRQEAMLLQEQMNSVKDEVTKVERDSSVSMRTLLKIDHVKSCMQEASQALREADNWSTLSADVEEVFERGDINAISTKLIGMQNSLDILVDVPDYKERSQRLEFLKDRLEAMISPQLIAAFNSQTNVADVALIYKNIFKDMKRLHRLQKYYHDFQKNQLLNQWKQILEVDPDDTLVNRMNSFYDALLFTWHSQMTICNQLLVEIPTIEVLAELLVDTMTSLEPTLEFCIEAAIKQQTNRIQFIIELKQITDRLAKTLDVSIQSIDSSFWKNVHIVVLAQAIYGPYRPHIEEYAVLEERTLIADLETLTFVNEEVIESVRLFRESVSKVFFFVQEADNRCHALTHGCAYAALFQALQGMFREYLGKFKHLQQLIRKAAKGQSKELGSDWMPFQQSLNAMLISGEVLLQLERLEQLLKSNLREISRKLSYYAIAEEDGDKTRNPFHAYDDILLTHAMKRELQLVVARSQEELNFSPLGDTVPKYRKLCSEMGNVLVDSILEQIRFHFNGIPQMKVWSEESSGTAVAELPTFSLSPLEYITEVGHFLMTIPQHIEPFILQDSPALYVALKNFKYPAQSQQDSIADYILECLAFGICEVYIESLLKITYISSRAINQLITDIRYFCEVLDDISISPISDIQSLLALLQAKPEEYSTESAGKPSRLVNAVKSIRKLQ